MALHEPLPLGADSHPSNSSGEPRESFGRYLLFKLLKRDPLGETYRAGLLGSNAVERVVSLRLFNGAGIDGERFWQASQSRQELGSTLRGGPFGEVVDSSYEGGVCYVAHEFIFGRSLAEMLDQARDTSCPVPIEHALHIMDRIAMSLHNANDQRLEGKRVSHGFLVPAFVQLSSEGEIQLTGFESTGGILDLPAGGAVRSELAGYTSPEVNQGQPPTGADDVYSMGSIFFELLTGEKLPPITDSGASQWIDAGILADEATPLSDEVRQLLHQSLSARDQRIKSAELWHRELAKITAAGEYSPTTFNLAFFMHTLFGEELDREVRLVEAEKLEQAPKPPAPSAPVDIPAEVDAAIASLGAIAPETAGTPETTPEVHSTEAPEPEPVTEVAPVEELTVLPVPDLEVDSLESLAAPATGEGDVESTFRVPDLLADATPSPTTSTVHARTQAAPDADSRRNLFLAIAALVVVVAFILAVFVFDIPIPGMGGQASEPMMVTAAPRLDDVSAMEPGEPALEPTSGELSDLTPPLSPEELESQVRLLVAERAGTMEKSLKAEYDQRLAKLRDQLEGARQAAATKQEAAKQEASAGQSESRTPAQPEPRGQIGRRGTPSPAQAAPPEKQPAVNKPSTSVPAQVAAVEIPTAEVEPEPPPAVATPTDQAATEPSAASAEPGVVEAGSIVEQGPGVSSPSLVRQPSVVYPPAAVRHKREATVRVRILVDEKGRPTEIEQIGPKLGMGFDQAGLRAAKSTRWTPPTKDGIPVKMWVELSVDFRP